MSIKLYNTLTRQKEDFVPLDRNDVRMYVCGPTVYDYAHIGNARPVIVFDVLFRFLRHLYGDDHVTYVRNITDVDDKINARAAAEGVSIRELTERTAKQFHDDIASLGVLPPTIEPRATEHIDGMIAMISRLIEDGHAYVADDHVLFDVSSDAHYGCLSNRSMDEMMAGARVEVGDYKQDPMDFVLWKPSTDDLPGWDSPWGRGRPGWHIECSVMSAKYLGQTFDIHGGGQDLIFPHHENEIAQSTCAHGNELMAKYWMHNGYLQVEGEKMSKSLGNFITIHELLETDKFGGRNWPGQALRLAMLMTHYRQPIDWTARVLADAYAALLSWAEIVGDAEAEQGEIPGEIAIALLNDLNTPGMIAEMYRFAKDAKGGDFDARVKLATTLAFLGFSNLQKLLEEHEAAKTAVSTKAIKESVYVVLQKNNQTLEQWIDAQIASRLAARAEKNWAEADRIRDELADQGIVLKDGKNPETGEIETTWEVSR